MRTRSCKHVFHTTCLHTWLTKHDGRTCPHCRHALYNQHEGSPGIWEDGMRAYLGMQQDQADRFEADPIQLPSLHQVNLISDTAQETTLRRYAQRYGSNRRPPTSRVELIRASLFSTFESVRAQARIQEARNREARDREARDREGRENLAAQLAAQRIAQESAQARAQEARDRFAREERWHGRLQRIVHWRGPAI